MQQDFVKVIRGSECIAWPDLVPHPRRHELVSFNLLSLFFANDFPISFEEPDFIRMHLNCQNLGNWRAASCSAGCRYFGWELFPSSFLNKFLRTLGWIVNEYVSGSTQIRESSGLIIEIEN